MYNQPLQPLDDLETLRVENERLKTDLLALQNQYNGLKRHFIALRSQAKIGDYASVLEICGVTEDDLFLEPDPTLD